MINLVSIFYNYSNSMKVFCMYDIVVMCYILKIPMVLKIWLSGQMAFKIMCTKVTRQKGCQLLENHINSMHTMTHRRMKWEAQFLKIIFLYKNVS